MSARWTTIFSFLPIEAASGTINAAFGNTTLVYSPIILSNAWSRLDRLIFVVCCCCFGTAINGFFVATFFVEKTLHSSGYVFLACAGLADMIVTSAVMPISALVLLSGQWENVHVCHVLHFLTSTSTYAYSLMFMMLSIDTCSRVWRASRYGFFSEVCVGFISILIFGISFVMAAIGVYFNFDYDYCQRKHYGNSNFQIATFIIFYVVPFVVTILGLPYGLIMIRRRAKKNLQYKRSQQYEQDNTTTDHNISAYLLYVFAWLPYVIVISMYPDTSDDKFYHCVWFGVCRSLLTSVMYITANRTFRRAFAHLFNYCFCKSSLHGSFTNRNRRALDYRPAGEVSVHIMHHAVRAATPHPRATYATRETMEL